MNDRASVGARLDAACAALGAALGLSRREARIEARALAALAWNVTPAWLIAHDTDPIDAAANARFQSLLARRLAGEPIAYIGARRAFYGRDLHVTPAVLIPRPETELLVEHALDRMPADRPCRILDLGTGSGAVAITLALERRNATVTAVDRSPAALAVARANAAALGARVTFLHSDWFEALAGQVFDGIVGNPPYVASDDPHLAVLRHEPLSALVAGPAGLDDLARIIPAAPAHLTAGGWLLLEHGFDQADAVRRLLVDAGFGEVQTWQDLAGCDRVSGGKCRKTLHSRVGQSG